MTQIWMTTGPWLRGWWPLAAALVAIVTLSACAGSDEAKPPIGSDSDGKIVELLNWVPLIPDTEAQVFIVNLAALRETGNVPLPADPSDLDQVIDYEQQLRDASGLDRFNVEFLGYEAPAEAAHQNLIEYLHFGYAHVDLVMEAGVAPTKFFLTSGRYDEDAAAASLTSCIGCVYSTETTEHEGMTYYAWGEDNETNLPERNGPPMLDMLGRGGRLVLTDELAVRANQSRTIEAMIEARKDLLPSLADHDDLVLAATTLDEEGVFLSYLTAYGQGPEFYEEFIPYFANSELLEDAWNPPPGTPVLREYQFMGIGATNNDGRPRVVVVLVHSSADDASANVDLLRRRIEETDSVVTGRPWSEQIRSAEVRANGRTLIATVDGLTLWEFHNEGDPLFLHE